MTQPLDIDKIVRYLKEGKRLDEIGLTIHDAISAVHEMLKEQSADLEELKANIHHAHKQTTRDYIPKNIVLDELQKMGEEIEEVVADYMRNEKQKDSLELIFEKQAQLLDHLNQSKPDNYYNGPERYPFEKVMHMMTAMSDEFSEVRAGLEWKYWKSYEEDGGEDDSAPNLPQNFLDLPDLEATQRQIISNSKLEYLQKEWIDIGHFYIQGAIELGLTPKKFLEMYLDKNSENHKRQDEGY